MKKKTKLINTRENLNMSHLTRMTEFFFVCVALSGFVLSVNGNKECYEAYSCASQSIIESTDAILCYGSNSCRESDIINTLTGSILCYASFSCYQALSIQRLNQSTSNPTRSIYCDGLFSCAGVSNITNYNGGVLC